MVEFNETNITSYARFKRYDIVFIPNKIKSLFNYIPKNKLLEYNLDINIAKEAILILISFFTPNVYNYKKSGILGDANKVLNSKILKSIFGNNYRILIDILLTGTNTPIIELVNTYVVGHLSNTYRLAERYLNKGYSKYTLTCKRFLTHFKKRHIEIINNTMNTSNPIIKNLIWIYNMIEIPSKEEVIAQGELLVRERYVTKKGKRLRKGKTANENKYPDSAWLEVHLEIFDYLITEGLLIPIESSCGRVIDAFNLMPSWIREMITINGCKLVEADYSTLHPNLNLHLYGDAGEKLKSIEHDDVAKALNISRAKVKTKHLTYFNERVDSMFKYGDMHEYYKSNYPVMMNNLINDKLNNGYKITAKRTMKLESDIMAEVIKRLNEVGIFALYIFDALCVKPDEYIQVKEIMNEIMIELNINSRVK